MSCFLNQKQFMGSLSEITREFSLEDNVYRDMIYTFDRGQIDEFNSLIDKIPYMFNKQYDISDKELLIVNGIEIQFPNFTVDIDKKTSTRLLFPDLAKKLEKDYVCTLVVDVIIYNKKTGLSSFDTRTLGTFPCMVNSKRCMLSEKPAEIPYIEQWFAMLGEDPSIPGGYFIKEGSKKAFLFGEKLALDTCITVFINKKKIYATRITSLFKSKTYLVRVHSGKHTSSVKIISPHLKGKHYPLFLVLYLLSRLCTNTFNCDLFIRQIAEMSPVKDRDYISSYLETSKIIFIKKFCVVNQVGMLEPVYTKINEYLVGKAKRAKYNELQPDLESIGILLKSEMFPGKTKTVEKIANLLSMISQHIRCCIGLRPLSNRDSWALKRLRSATDLIEQDIADNLIPCLKTGINNNTWRIGKKDIAEHIIEPVKTDSINLTRALLTKVNATVDDKTKEFSVRAVAKTGFGGICPGKTAEGVKCGINKHKAICTRTSWNSEYIPDRLRPIFDILFTPTFSFLVANDFFTFKVVLRDIKNKEARFEFPFFVSKNFLDFVFKRGIIEAKFENPFLILNVDFDGSSDVALWDATIVRNVPLNQGTQLNEIKFYFAIINEYSSMKRMDKYEYIFTYNGNVLLNSENPSDTLIYPYPVYIDHNLVLTSLKKLRRSRKLPIDCCIYKNETDLIIQYYDDSGRLMCPYLLANDDGDLIFDVTNCKELWSDFNGIHDYTNAQAKIDELFNRGALEYVDQKELETTLIAKNINEFRRFANLRHFLNKIDFEKTESYCYQIKDTNYFKNEDMTYVTLNGKNFDVVFTPEPKIKNDIVTIESRLDNGMFLKLYGQIAFQTKVYTQTKKQIITLNKDDYQNYQKRDGFNLFYFDNNGKINPIPKGNVGIDDTHYNGNKIVSIKFKTPIISKIVTILDGKEYILEDHNFQKITNTGKKWVHIENNNFEWNDTFYNKGKLYNMVDFKNIPIGQSEYFEVSDKTIYQDLLTTMKYEKFDINDENKWFNDVIKTDAPNNSDCDLLISYIRRSQEHLDNVKFSNFDEAKESIDMLRKEIPLFMKRSSMYKVWRYLLWRFKFTHAPIDPNIAYSSVANLVTSANYNQGPRFAFQCAMATQAVGLGNIMHFATFETSIKRLTMSEGHLCRTVAEEPLASNTMPTRINFNLLVFTNVKGPEDAIVISESMLKKLRYDRDITITVRERIINQVEEMIGSAIDYRGNKKVGGIFSNLSESGLPHLGSIIKIGDAIVGQTKIDRKSNKMRDISTKSQRKETGEIVQIHVISNEETKKERIVRLKLSQRRTLMVGDKLAAVPAQKGVISTTNKYLDKECIHLLNFPFLDEGMIKDLKDGKIKCRVADDNEMPRVIGGPNDGMAINLIFSPFSFPSRMTLGMNFEILTGKLALRTQKEQDTTTFRKINVPEIEKMLVSFGLNKFSSELLAHSDGEIMYDSTKGTQMMGYVGPQSYQVLKHNVLDKEAIACGGPRDSIAQQPVGGLLAQRMGEMERDCLLSHGAPNLQRDRMLYDSDVYDAIVCKNCGNRTSESDLLIGTCKICSTNGSLAILQQPRILSVFSQQLNSLGMCVKYKFEK